MKVNKYIQIAITVIIFTGIVSVVSPVISISTNAATKTVPDVNEDFSLTPTPHTAVLGTSATSATPAASSKASPTASTSAKPTTTASGSAKPVQSSLKMTVYKGEVSATPSAIGKFVVTTEAGEKNIDTDKTTKTFIFDKGGKTLSAVSKIKVGDKVIVIGNMSEDGKSLVARYIMVMKIPSNDKPHTAIYGLVTSREASGAAFILHIKSPNDDKDNSFTLNNDSVIKVKDVESPKLSDVKIGDRVTLAFSTDPASGTNYITRIFVIPGRAAGLLRDIREASAASQKKDKEDKAVNDKASPTVSAKPSPTGSALPKNTP